MITLVFTHRRDIYHRIVQWRTHCEYTHCGIYWEDEAGTPHIIHAAYTAGVIIEAYKDYLRYYPSSKIVRFAANQPDAIIDIAKSKKGFGFDWRAVIGKSRHDGIRFSSSGLVAYAFQHANEPLFRYLPPNLSPRDIYMLNPERSLRTDREKYLSLLEREG